MITLRATAEASRRKETFEGREYLVLPVIALVEGVHNGSNGRLMYSASEMAKFPDCWNGRPVTLRHPEDSANVPTTLERQSIGTLFNMTFAENRLRGELWIDIAKATELCPSVLTRLQEGEVMEVSTGLFADVIQTAGTWQGEAFDGFAVNFRPDHIALLPDQTGACSVKDGCGVRANAESGKTNSHKERPAMSSKWQAIKSTIKQVRKTLLNEMSLDDISRGLSLWVNSLDNPEFINFLSEVFDGYFIYETMRRDAMTGVSVAATLFKRSYSVNQETGEVVVADDAQEVREVTTYEPVTANATNDNKPTNNSQEDRSMAKKETIDKLIACNCTPFAESDRSWLDTVPDEMLARLSADNFKEPEKPEKPERPEITNQDPPKPLTFTDILATAPVEVRNHYERIAADAATRKTELIAKLVEAKCAFSEADLKEMSLDMIEKIANTAKIGVKRPDYSAAAGAPSDAVTNAAVVEMVKMPRPFEPKSSK